MPDKLPSNKVQHRRKLAQVEDISEEDISEEDISEEDISEDISEEDISWH